MDLKKELLDSVDAADWSVEDKELARRVAERYAEALVEKLQGLEVDEELEALKASLQNVGAAAAATGAQVFWSVVHRVLQALLVGLRPA